MGSGQTVTAFYELVPSRRPRIQLKARVKGATLLCSSNAIIPSEDALVSS